MTQSTITSIPPELTGILASYLPPEESERSVKIFDPNGTYDENTYHELCKTHHRVSIKPQDVSWKDHYHNCENGFYERVKRAYARGADWYERNYETVQKVVKTAYTATLLTGAALFLPGAVPVMAIGAGIGVGAAIQWVRVFRERRFRSYETVSYVLEKSIHGAVVGASTGSLYSLAAVKPLAAASIAGASAIASFPYLSLKNMTLAGSIMFGAAYISKWGALLSAGTFSDIRMCNILDPVKPLGKVCGKIAGAFNWLKTCITG